MRFYRPTTSKSEKTLRSKVINLWANKNSRIVSCTFSIKKTTLDIRGIPLAGQTRDAIPV